MTLSSHVLHMLVAMICFSPLLCSAQGVPASIDLKQTIVSAIQASLQLQTADSELHAAQADKKARRTAFFPSLNVKYEYLRRDEPSLQSLNFQKNDNQQNAIINPIDEFQLTYSFSQPVFRGFELLNRYKISGLKVEIAKFSKEKLRLDIMKAAIDAYFSILKSEKMVNVAYDALEEIRSQKDVTQKMLSAGFISMTDLLQSQVELLRARQVLLSAENNLKKAGFRFNTLLQRPLTSPVRIREMGGYHACRISMDDCLDAAAAHRMEIKIIDQEIAIAEKEYALSKKDIYPVVNVVGTLLRRGTDMQVDGGLGIGDKNTWNIRIEAGWEFWDWGRTHHVMDEKLSRIVQARFLKKQLEDDIKLEVRDAYLTMTEIENAILTAKTAAEHARTNFEIIKVKYKKKIVAMVDYLEAQSLLTETAMAYYNALYDYKIAKTDLYHTIGKGSLGEYMRLLTR